MYYRGGLRFNCSFVHFAGKVFLFCKSFLHLLRIIGIFVASLKNKKREIRKYDKKLVCLFATDILAVRTDMEHNNPYIAAP